MALPPHILKYQKQLNELNKISSLAKQNTSSNPISKSEPEEKTKKNKNSKNKTNNDFLPPKNRSVQNSINLSEIEEVSIPAENQKSKKKETSQKEDEMTKNWKIYRKGAGIIWEDESLNEWPDNDYRIFVGDLGNEVNDQTLANAFMKYQSFVKAKVVRNRLTGKTRGYGFVSIMDVDDYIRAMKEMDGKYIGNRPVKLKRSTWKDRSVLYSKSRISNVICIKKKRNRNNKEDNNQNGGQKGDNPIADDVTNLLNIDLDMNSLVNQK